MFRQQSLLWKRFRNNCIQPDALLTKLGMFESGKLTRAAVLLLGTNPQKFNPYASVKVGRFKSPTMIEDEREIRGCLIKQMSEAMDWLFISNAFCSRLA